MRDPNKLSVEVLLRSDEQFIVPKYQRGYDWKGNAQVKDLFMDFEACLKSSHNDELFLGTMIFDVSEEKNNKVYVIDGQQRITTLILVLIACRTFARRVIKSEKLAVATQNSITSTDPLLEGQRMQLMPSETILDVFSRICDYEWDEKFPDTITVGNTKKSVKRQNSRVRPIYQYALEEIKRLCSTNEEKFKQLLRQIYKKSYVIKIDIEERSEAFEIFERTNARGKGLEISDLLKNYLFSKNAEVKEFDVEDAWKEISENAGSSILRMLKYFWISRRGQVTTRDLYRNIREYAQKNGTAKFITELQEFSSFFAAYESKNRTTFPDWLTERGFKKDATYLGEASRALGALKTFRITQVVPLIYSITQAYLKEDGGKRKPKTFLSLLRLVESYHFVNNKVCNRIGNEVEKLYSEFSEKFYDTEDFSETMGEFKARLVPNMAKRDEFIASFSNISYTNQTERSLIRYIFDAIANVGVKSGQRRNLIDHFELSNNIRGAYDIEHLQAQSLAPQDEDSDYYHEIGNLLVIPKQINGILGNDTFHEKMDKLLNPSNHKNNIKHVDDFILEFARANAKKTEWTIDDIRMRTQNLAKQSYKIAANRYAYK